MTTYVARRPIRKMLMRSSMNTVQTPSFADIMTALIQIQDNQAHIMDGITDIKYNQSVIIMFQAAVAENLAGLHTPTANAIDAQISNYIGQLY
jgi:hypothetical protein